MPADPKKYNYLWKDYIVSHPELSGWQAHHQTRLRPSGLLFQDSHQVADVADSSSGHKGYNHLNKMLPAPGRPPATPAARNPQMPPTGLTS